MAADPFDHPVFGGQVVGVFKEMKSWFDKPVKQEPPKVEDAKPVVVQKQESKVAHVEVSDAKIKRIRDETCAKPNAVCWVETLR